MFPVSARFISEIAGPHTVYSYVTVTSPTQISFTLPAVGGEVQVDGTSEYHRRASISCIDPLGELTPSGSASILMPFGTEIRPYRGVVFTEEDGSKTVEVVPLGVFRLAKVNVRDSVGGSPVISLEGFDRSRTIARDKFTEPYIIQAGTDIVTAIKAIVSRTFPDCQYNSISTSVATTVDKIYDTSDNPWEAITELARSIGCDVFFDVIGWLNIKPPVEINDLPAPIASYAEGNGCMMLDLELVYSDEPGYNGVVVTGESPGDELPPVRAVAWDEDPASPTYHKGPYGEVPLFITDQNVKTQADAQAMANSLLQKLLGFSSQLSISAQVNPALEYGDVIEVRRARVHVSGSYALDAFNIPLGADGTQSLTLRQKRSIENDDTD